MANRQDIKDFYGRKLGTIEELPSGNKIARDFYGKILGEYDKNRNITKNFYGQIVASGDITASLIWEEASKHRG